MCVEVKNLKSDVHCAVFFMKCPGYMKQCNPGRTIQLLSMNVIEVFVATLAREWFFSNMGPAKYFSQNWPFLFSTYKNRQFCDVSLP